MIEDVNNFPVGSKVWKRGAGYSGPGEVVAAFTGRDGHYRYVVAHTIEAGSGDFYHIYGAGQLTRIMRREL